MCRRKMCDVIGQFLEFKRRSCRLYSTISCGWAWLNIGTPLRAKLVSFPYAILCRNEVFTNHIYGEKLLNSMHPEMRCKLFADQFSL